MQLHQDAEAGTAHISSVSEFLLTQPILSFALLDAGRRRLVKAQEYNAEHAWSCTTGDYLLVLSVACTCIAYTVSTCSLVGYMVYTVSTVVLVM